ncbi:PAS domain S-box protein [Methanococcoides orientis]|uniref:PAS domain S-box protein n=1 Tax=Methanococcoides orientis TaxID=2822137 RepID=UPI001E41C0DF|nr:PAS domain S-box protein [Methanococcoides orientis]UGV41790.1 PAS domain S-box protein [Methanococcoides orientis]
MQEYSQKMNLPISDVPHGENITLVYRNGDKVIDFVSSFLRSGLKHNDLCVWITPGLKKNEGPDAFFKEKTIFVNEKSFSSNFDLVLMDMELLSDAEAFSKAILEFIEKKHRSAIKCGFNGLRITIDLISDEGKMLPFLKQCRKFIISATSDIELTTLFTCPLESFSSSDLFELMDDRENTIMKKNGMWTSLMDLLSNKYRKHLRFSPELMKKEKELKSIYMNSPVVAFLRSSGNGFPVEFVSENISQFGYSAEDLVSHKVLYEDLIHPWDTDDYFLSFSECIKNGDNEFTKEYRILDREANTRWVSETSLIGRDKYGKPSRFQGIIVDITERKLAEEALKRSELKFKALFDNSNDPVFLYDLDGNIFEANNKACECLGYSREVLLQKKITETYSKECVVDFQKRVLEVCQQGNCIFEMVSLRNDGSEIPVEMSSQLMEYDGNPAILSIFRDITEHKNIEKTLLDAKTEAEAANRLKSEFLANMSHELRTPLNSVIGFSDILLENDTDLLSDIQMKYIENISKSGCHLLTLINDILDLSKIEAGKMELQHEKFRFREVLNDVEAVVSPLAEKKNICLSTSNGADDLCINADRLKLTQVLFNLVSNAIKFTQEGGSVMIRAENDADTLVIKVEDTGIGIPESAQCDLFNPFTQVESSPNRQFGGTGLGLSIAKKLIKLHGGDIWVESEPGSGSVFGFSVPLSPKLS